MFAGTAIGAVTASLPVFLLVALVALAGVVLYAANPPHDDVTVTAAGEAVVEREQFNAFPDNTTVYPNSLGATVRMATLNQRLEWSDEQ